MRAPSFILVDSKSVVNSAADILSIDNLSILSVWVVFDFLIVLIVFVPIFSLIRLISLVMLSIKEVKPLDLIFLTLSGYQSGFFFCQISLSSVASVSVSL